MEISLILIYSCHGTPLYWFSTDSHLPHSFVSVPFLLAEYALSSYLKNVFYSNHSAAPSSAALLKQEELAAIAVAGGSQQIFCLHSQWKHTIFSVQPHHLLVPEDEQTGSLSYHSLFCDIVDTLPPSNSWPAFAIKDAIENLSFPMGLLQHSSEQKQPYRTAAASHFRYL